MDREKFWDNIDVGRAGSETLSDQAEKMVIVFKQMDPDQIIDYYHHFHDCMDGLLRWETWAVAHIILGDCDQQQFRNFRAFIISQNREAFDSFFHDPIGSPFDLELEKTRSSRSPLTSRTIYSGSRDRLPTINRLPNPRRTSGARTIPRTARRAMGSAGTSRALPQTVGLLPKQQRPPSKRINSNKTQKRLHRNTNTLHSDLPACTSIRPKLL